MSHHSSKIFLPALALLVACSMDTASQQWAVDGGSCPRWQCGNNGPEINGLPLGELDLTGGENPEGYRILAVTDLAGVPLALDVHDGMFHGTPPNGPVRTAEDMIGARIIIEDVATGVFYAVAIIDFEHVSSWTTPSFEVPAYRFLVAEIDPETWTSVSPYDEVCGSTTRGGLFAAHAAVLIKGERYDPYTKTVAATGPEASNWFNLACSGSALSKMKRMGYDPEFTDNGTTQATTTAQREATLKMITAAYCPSGVSFTENGRALRWENRDGTVQPYASMPPERTPEAIWTEDGALCLDVPRLESLQPGIGAAIAAECGTSLPSCDDILDEWRDHGEWRTSNPVNAHHAPK